MASKLSCTTAQQQSQKHFDLALAANESEFPDGKVAMGAAMTYIDELKAALPPQKFQQILSLLGDFHTHKSLKEKDVYLLVKRILKGVEGEEALLRGFERFMPGGVVGVEEEGKAEEEGKKEGEKEGNKE